MNYKVLKRIWHTWDECTYEPGAEVSLWHLSQEEKRLLVSKGIVRKVVEKPVPKSVPKKLRAGSRVSKKKPVIKPVVKKKPVIENMEENK